MLARFDHLQCIQHLVVISSELAPVETVVHYNHWRRPSFEFVRAPHPWSLPPLTRSTFRTFSSAAPSGLLPEMMEYFGFGKEVGALTVSLFISGYCLGPLLWGPLSEDVSLSKAVPPMTFTQIAL